MHALIVALLLGFATDPPVGALHVQQPGGKAVWDLHCKKCHGVTGTPAASMKRMMPKLPVVDSTFMSTFTVQGVADAVAKGAGTMKPMGEKLTAEELAAVAKYVFALTNAKPAAAKGSK